MDGKMSRRSFLSTSVIGGFVAARVRLAGEIPWSEEPLIGDGVNVTRNEETSEVILGNERIRVRFHPGKPKFGVFPKGYAGYTVELRSDGA